MLLSNRFPLHLLGCVLSIALAATCTAQNLLINGGFDAGGTAPPAGWQTDPSLVALGTANLNQQSFKSRPNSLQLTPNSGNGNSDRYQQIFAITQTIAPPSTTTPQLYVSAWMQARSGSVAVLRIYAFLQTGQVRFQEIRHAGSAWALRRDVFSMPNDQGVTALRVACMVEGATGRAYFDEVSVTTAVPPDWLEANGAPDPGTALEAVINVDASQTVRKIPSTLYGTNLEWPWDGNGIWDPTRSALNPSLVSLTSAEGTRLQRYPGGILSDFYNWRSGIGPQSSRGSAPIYPGGPVETYRFGTDEALSFADATGAQLLITVNLVTATATDAADWVRYVNSKNRRVQYWEIGNESYVAAASGPASISAMSPEAYAARFVEFASAMRAADPGIKIGAIADESYSHNTPRSYQDWTDRVLKVAASQIDFVAVHLGYAPVIPDESGLNPRTVYSAMMACPSLIRDQLTDLSRRIAALVPARASQIRIGVTEWGPLFQDSNAGHYVDHTKTMGSALYAASTLKTFIESSRTDIANAFKLVDASFMGWIGNSQGNWIPKASYFAFQMYTAHFGTNLVLSSTTSPTYDAPKVGWVDAAGPVPYLETVSSTSADRKTLYVMVINKHMDRAIHARLTLNGFTPAGTGTVYTLNGTGTDANTGTELFQLFGTTWAPQVAVPPEVRFELGGPNEVGITASTISGVGTAFDYVFPSHSVTSIVLGAK